MRYRVISVPWPRVFPRGSGYISNDPSFVEELKMVWMGLEFLDDGGGKDATTTSSATRKL